jgi:hypothetical protein
MAGSLSRGQYLTTASRLAGNADAAAYAVQVRAAGGATLDVLTFVIEQAAILLVELACARPSHDQSAKSASRLLTTQPVVGRYGPHGSRSITLCARAQ